MINDMETGPLTEDQQAMVEERLKELAAPDYIFDPDDWEYTIEWASRDQVADDAEIQEGEVKRFCTLIRGPVKFCVLIDNNHQWFDNEADARAAAGQPDKDLFQP